MRAYERRRARPRRERVLPLGAGARRARFFYPRLSPPGAMSMRRAISSAPAAVSCTHRTARAPRITAQPAASASSVARQPSGARYSNPSRDSHSNRPKRLMRRSRATSVTERQPANGLTASRSVLRRALLRFAPPLRARSSTRCTRRCTSASGSPARRRASASRSACFSRFRLPAIFFMDVKRSMYIETRRNRWNGGTLPSTPCPQRLLAFHRCSTKVFFAVEPGTTRRVCSTNKRSSGTLVEQVNPLFKKTI